MSILDDENILIDSVNHQIKCVYSILKISNVVDKRSCRQELVDYLNTYLTFDNYRWEGYIDGLALAIPNVWMSYIITIKWDKYSYRFDFLGNETDSDYLFIKELRS